MGAGRDQFGSPGCSSASCALSTRRVWRRGFSETTALVAAGQRHKAQGTAHIGLHRHQGHRGRHHQLEAEREALSGNKSLGSSRSISRMQHSPAGPQLLPPKHCSGSLGTGCEEQPECFSRCHWHLCTQGQGKEQRDQQGAPGQQCPAEGCRMEHSHLRCQKQRSCPLLRCPVDPKHTALSPTNTAVTCPGLLFDFSTAFPSTTSLCENCNKKHQLRFPLFSSLASLT